MAPEDGVRLGLRSSRLILAPPDGRRGARSKAHDPLAWYANPRDYLTGSSVDGPDIQGIPVRETSQTRAPTFINVQLRLEMKL